MKSLNYLNKFAEYQNIDYLCSRQEYRLCSVYKNIKQQTVFKDAKQAILYALLIPVVENSISEKEIIVRNAAAICGGQDCCAL